MFNAILNPLAVLMSFSTATGVLVHDMHIDQAASALAMPAQMASIDTTKSVNLGGADHTHVERASLSQSLHLHAANQSIQPRSEDKKYLLQKRVMRGHHAFDNYNLPIV
jgi:hypothetical protein